MTSDIPQTQSSQSHNKWDFVFYFVVLVGTSGLMNLLCNVLSLYSSVLLWASVVGMANAIYYGVIWRKLQKSFRIGLAIFFFASSFIGILLYRNSLQVDEASPSGMVMLAQLFGFFVVGITAVFIYKHKTPSFWNWV